MVRVSFIGTSIRMGLVALSALLSSIAAARPVAPVYRLFFPRMHLNQGEQIEGFDLAVACGHIVTIRDIPFDWNINVVRAVSAVEELHASAGHGISYVRQLDRFNGNIHLTPTDTTCFNVTATVMAVSDSERPLKLTRPALQLRR